VTPSVPPAERVRARVAKVAGAAVAERLPRGYQRLGSVLVVRLPESLRPHFGAIGAAWLAEMRVECVLRHAGTTEGEFRRPRVERIAGGTTETEVRENGIRYRFDAARIMFAAGNREERARAGRNVRAGESVVDLFAGIGYFTLPAAVHGRPSRVLAVEANPVAHHYLEENLRLNGVADRVEPILGDNRSVALPAGGADHVFLGYLPSAVPWVPDVLRLLRPAGGKLHVHLVVGTRGGVDEARSTVVDAVVRAGGSVEAATAGEVKPYGPGRLHAVVDLAARVA